VATTSILNGDQFVRSLWEDLENGLLPDDARNGVHGGDDESGGEEAVAPPPKAAPAIAASSSSQRKR